MKQLKNGMFAWPKEVAGIRAPNGKFAKIAQQKLEDTAPPFLINHSARVYYFGTLLGRAKGVAIDGELFFLACMLHDIGLTDRHLGDLPFEIQGAQAARELLLKAGLSPKRADVVWDGIAMHTLAIADFKRPEIALVSAGADTDVTGAGLELIGESQIEEVLQAFPRLNFNEAFVTTCADAIRKHPSTAGRTFMRDIAERRVPEFHPSNICDRIDASPFAD